MKKNVLILFVYFVSLQLMAQFSTPIEGIYLKDFFIINYPDTDTGKGIKDTYCGTKTYDRHEGTDFVIRNFKQMDSGVAVLAAADGVVFKVVKNKFDRNKNPNPNLGLGNYIGIWHVINGKNYYTYYAHLKINSTTVDSGDIVIAGQKIGLVGSSGYATDPHLHFELYSDTGLIDPFIGNCSITRNQLFWNNTLTYDTSTIKINEGIVKGYPDLENLKEAPNLQNIFNSKILNANDSIVSYWWQGTGIKKNDNLKLQWLTPQDSIWFTYNYTVPQDYWYYYYYSYIYNPFLIINNPKLGTWKANLYLNNQKIGAQNFVLTASNSIQKITKHIYTITSKGLISITELNIECYNAMGQKISLNKSVENGLYCYKPQFNGLVFFIIFNPTSPQILKAIVNE